MGCNFYWRSDTDDKIHIGKRIASGPYCYNCRIKIEYAGDRTRCHRCGTRYKDEPIPAAAALELGFREEPVQFIVGVHSSSGFIFAQKPQDIAQQLKAGKSVVDEYDHEYSPNEFRRIIKGCVIHDYNFIGQNFL